MKSLVVCFISLILAEVCLAKIPIGYESYSQWGKLGQLRLGAKSGLASSYDRSGGNNDWNWYEWPEGSRVGTATTCRIKTIQGPGVIYRYWMPHCMSKKHYPMRMYFDGELTARIDTFSDTILNGSYSYFTAPLVDTFAGGQVCYDPIPFSNSVIIETVNRNEVGFYDRNYYQYSYLTYAGNVGVDSWTGVLSADEQADRNALVSMFAGRGQNPEGDSDTAIDVTITDSVVNTDLLLADLEGPGVIGELRIKMTDVNDANLQVFYDDKEEAAIDVPVGYFFGAGEMRADFNSLPIGAGDEGFYCYWPMPFKKSIKVNLHNNTVRPIGIDFAKIKYELQELDHHSCYLHAVESNTTMSSGKIYHNILTRTGQGHYVGDLLYVTQAAGSNSFFMLEGDDAIFCDGELVQYGTGLEDTYNGGAYYNWVAIQSNEPEGSKPQSASRALNGILYVDGVNMPSRADQYRWRIADCIPFTDSIEVNVECRYSYAGARWKSVGFWYELPGLLADINEDGIVNLKDFGRLSLYWGQTDCDTCGYSDLTGDGNVNFEDIIELADHWLECD